MHENRATLTSDPNARASFQTLPPGHHPRGGHSAVYPVRPAAHCANAVRQVRSLVSAPGIAHHESTCQPAKRQRRNDLPVEEAPRAPLSVLYVPSVREGESGKFVFEGETLFEGIPWLTVHRGKTAEGEYWVDAYDALFATLQKRGHCNLVCVGRDRKALKARIEGQEALTEGSVDVLVWPNWLFELGKAPDALNEWVELLRQYERVHRCVLFPPVEYALFFARKDVWTHRASQLGLPTIPTHYAYPKRGKWRAGVAAFAQEQGTTHLVMKRALGECARHVFCHVMVGAKGSLSGLPKTLEEWPYLVQPYVDEFDQRPELRLYVLDGVLAWGLESRWTVESGALEYDDWTESRWPGAHALAERVAQTLAQSCCGEAGRFLRVDMIQRSDGTWYVNEAEFFGNAHLLFPSVGSQQQMDRLVEVIRRWLSACVRK
jgi:hypothetical protein